MIGPNGMKMNTFKILSWGFFKLFRVAILSIMPTIQAIGIKMIVTTVKATNRMSMNKEY
jgi:hypothetical protein